MAKALTVCLGLSTAVHNLHLAITLCIPPQPSASPDNPLHLPRNPLHPSTTLCIPLTTPCHPLQPSASPYNAPHPPTTPCIPPQPSAPHGNTTRSAKHTADPVVEANAMVCLACLKIALAFANIRKIKYTPNPRLTRPMTPHACEGRLLGSNKTTCTENPAQSHAQKRNNEQQGFQHKSTNGLHGNYAPTTLAQPLAQIQLWESKWQRSEIVLSQGWGRGI